MILTIAITGLGIGNLFLLNSLRFYSREIFWLALMNGIFVIQSAHLIFDGIAVGKNDHPLMVNAVFTILYLPALCIFYCIVYSREKHFRFLIYGSAVFIVIFCVLYFKLFIEVSMPVMSYANLIWHLEVIVIIFFLREISGGASAGKSKVPALTGSHINMAKIWCLVIMMPYLIGLVAVLFPPDNFVMPYRPVMSTQIAIQLATIGALVGFMAGVLRHKSTADKQRSMQVAPRKLKDLAF